ncbi:LysR family transcriptional regulator [Nitrogeniibacter mangrovi]|uniref:LysR family transcriptional regulator n=1 Tax=Nitrogeniibacter mangrovi TaxID=2016596 RepID=A0A6C1B2R7_9RHOO|nr:LysR family transcriptional regulator [Nitrogeniibacter mangrovi]QID17673.1 LysR family transcriptional regulator [Nitrogeniibacter mangrovi]
MDITLAKTFIEVVRCGSFVAAAEQLHVTQTTVTARIQSLEGLLGCALFVRSRHGAAMTANGERFLGHAAKLLQAWEAARRDLPLPDGHDTLFSFGGEVSLCNPMLFTWAARLREHAPSQAIRVEAGEGDALQLKVANGELDAALVYQPVYRPGIQVEQLLEEKLVQVGATQHPEPYVYVDWGPEFRHQHDIALPHLAKAALHFNLGPLALQYLLQFGGRGYFRTRVVDRYIASGQLQHVADAPEFSYPVYLVYSRENRSAFLEGALDILRTTRAEDIDWSQRWEH